jgi:hypothetical protein
MRPLPRAETMLGESGRVGVILQKDRQPVQFPRENIRERDAVLPPSRQIGSRKDPPGARVRRCARRDADTDNRSRRLCYRLLRQSEEKRDNLRRTFLRRRGTADTNQYVAVPSSDQCGGFGTAEVNSKQQFTVHIPTIGGANSPIPAATALR